MPRYSASCVTTNGGTAARPVMSLFGIAAVGARIVEIGIANTTTTSCQFRVARCTAAGTPGTALDEAKYDTTSASASCTAANSHSADATIDTGTVGGIAQLGAAIGAGWIWTYGDGGLRIPVGTANGIGIVPVGTGQVLTAYIVWDE
jgi:hypothetical protein